MLILQAEVDTFVDNVAMAEFFSRLGTEVTTLSTLPSSALPVLFSGEQDTAIATAIIAGASTPSGPLLSTSIPPSLSETDPSIAEDVKESSTSNPVRKSRRQRASKLVRLTDSYHILLSEDDEVFEEIIEEVLSYLKD
jgi:hypothetical protein